MYKNEKWFMSDERHLVNFDIPPSHLEQLVSLKVHLLQIVFIGAILCS